MTPLPVLILLRSGGWQARWLATAVALSAAAHGEPVQLALFEEALAAFAAGRFDEGGPESAAAARVGSLRAMLEEGRALGLRLVACDTAVRLAGLDPEELAPGIEVTSLTEMWRNAAGGRILAF
jgi:peroxiredoxin family protein